MSVLLGFDTEKIIRSKLALAQKKYPAKLMKNNKGSESAYWKIKKAHRKKRKS
jgi:hypothetical protein